MACIAGDSLTTFEDTRQSSHYEKSYDKIHSFADNRLGLVGSAAHHIVMQHLLTADNNDYSFNNRMAIFESFRNIHPLLKDNYFLNPKEHEDDPYESSRIDALLINPHGIYGVYAMREVFEYSRFWAIGSGSEYALGAMFAVYEQLDSAEDIARIGVEAGTEFDTSSSLPLTSYSVTLNELS